MTPNQKRIFERNSRLKAWIIAGKDSQAFAAENDMTSSYTCTVLNRMGLRMKWVTPEEWEKIQEGRK